MLTILFALPLFRMNNVEVALALCRMGADQTVTTKSGRTPIATALVNRCYDCFWAVVSEGADVEGRQMVGNDEEELDLFDTISTSKLKVAAPRNQGEHDTGTREEQWRRVDECWAWALSNCKIRPKAVCLREMEQAEGMLEAMKGLPEGEKQPDEQCPVS